jgi:hypothetical protein
MKKSFTLVIVLILVLFLSVPGYSQFKLAVGPGLGMNFNLHTGSDLKESGSGFGMVFGGYTDMSFSPSIGLIAGLAFYDNRSGSTSSTGTEQVQGVGPVNFTQDYDASLAYFQIESLFKLAIPRSGFYFIMGPVIGFNISSEGESTTTITTPGITFQDGSTKQTAKATIKDTQVRFELKAGAGYDIPISRLITLAPNLTFGYGLTNVQKDVKWKILTIQLMGTVKFNLI